MGPATSTGVVVMLVVFLQASSLLLGLEPWRKASPLLLGTAVPKAPTKLGSLICKSRTMLERRECARKEAIDPLRVRVVLFAERHGIGRCDCRSDLGAASPLGTLERRGATASLARKPRPARRRPGRRRQPIATSAAPGAGGSRAARSSAPAPRKPAAPTTARKKASLDAHIFQRPIGGTRGHTFLPSGPRRFPSSSLPETKK